MTRHRLLITKRRALTEDDGALDQGIAKKLGIPIADVLNSDETEAIRGRIVSTEVHCANQKIFHAIFCKLLQRHLVLRYVQFVPQTECLHITYMELFQSKEPERMDDE